MLHLDHLGAQSRKEPTGACAGKHPTKIHDSHTTQRKRFAAFAYDITYRVSIGFRDGPSGACRLPKYLRIVFTQQRSPRTRPPGKARCHPLCPYLRERPSDLGVIHIQEGFSLRPMILPNVLLRSPDRRPRQSLFLPGSPDLTVIQETCDKPVDHCTYVSRHFRTTNVIRVPILLIAEVILHSEPLEHLHGIL